ncbi:putative methyltransferase NSUN6 isoform X3 [Acanthaster planci]|uniref:Methyltransferase NSUN6 isoform X3 n=1 Tax=Acanthaster planci TaxID=133434 RepID=A0A8B7Z9E8_ACAPL|nr:putative methyltransferase NSUN6 isoform X3 [Acanthaster planci]
MMGSVTLPKVTFQPYVEELLEKSYLNEKAISQVGDEVCKQRWNSLLTALSYPPAYTVLRVNTLHHSKEDTKQQLSQALYQQFSVKQRLPAEVSDHPCLDDTLIITSGSLPGTNEVPVSPCSKQVIVDQQCGLAVLRGADIFAPGVLAALPDMVKGDKVSVYVDVNGSCRRGLTKPFEGEKVFLGNGDVVLGRRELFVTTCVPRGVAVRMTEPICDCPSLNGVLTDRLFLQNLPSIVVGHVVSPAVGSRVLDMCAAPGGKTTHLATLMKDQGVVIALDKSTNKIRKVEENAKRLGLSCIHAYSYDSTKACSRDMKMLMHDADVNAPPYPPGTFDCVLLDAPCSGLGQRPQISNQLQLSELKSYPAYQRMFFSTEGHLCTAHAQSHWQKMKQWWIGPLVHILNLNYLIRFLILVELVWKAPTLMLTS